MKINLSNVSNKQLDSLTGINLRVGQQIVGKILSVNHDEVLLQIAGHSVKAKLDGAVVNEGSNYSFRVLEGKNGNVELKILTSLNDSSIKELLFQEMQRFETKYQYPLKSEIMTFIFSRKWPITPGTIMLAWITVDPKMRNALWKLRQQSLPAEQSTEIILSARDDPEAVKQFLIKNSQSFNALFKSETSKENKTANATTTQGKTEETADLFEQFKKLLDISCRLQQKTEAETNTTVNSTLVRFPVLVDLQQQQIQECSIEWQSDSNNSTKESNQEQLIKIEVPTANLGLIEVEIGINSKLTKVNFSVDTESVKNLIAANNIELKQMLEEQLVSNSALINVSLKPDKTIKIGTGELDLWM